MKKVMKAAFVVAVAAVAGYNIYTNLKSNTMSDMMLANVEALASGEGGSDCKWDRAYDSYGCVYHVCTVKGNGDACTCGAVEG